MDDQFPFISSLEAFPFPDAMFAGITGDLAWFSMKSYDYGATEPIFRYPRDKYSRIWEPKIPNGTVVVNASFDSLYSMTIDDPPDVAIIQAVEATTPADTITLSFPSSKGKSLDHVIVDFTKVDELEINETRHFDLNVNGEKMLTLNPEYRTCSTSWANLQSEGTFNVELRPAEDSDIASNYQCY